MAALFIILPWAMSQGPIIGESRTLKCPLLALSSLGFSDRAASAKRRKADVTIDYRTVATSHNERLRNFSDKSSQRLVTQFRSVTV
jgi:hypothetical protein